MKKSMDPSQCGNQYGLSIQYYLINMIDKSLSDTDSKGITAFLAIFLDWKDSFPNQCLELGIKTFIKCGVRPFLIPVLISYFQERSVIVKWNGGKLMRGMCLVEVLKEHILEIWNSKLNQTVCKKISV